MFCVTLGNFLHSIHTYSYICFGMHPKGRCVFYAYIACNWQSPTIADQQTICALSSNCQKIVRGVLAFNVMLNTLMWSFQRRHLPEEPHTACRPSWPMPHLVGCVAQLAERRSLAGELTLSCARPVANGWPLVGKPSVVGQPTRPTQPFILPGSINE